MNPQLEAAWQLHCFFTERQIPYFVIGGIAVQFWGEPRLTRDVDITIVVEPGEERGVAEDLLQHFPARIENALDFALQHRVVLLAIPSLCEVDISLGFPGYEGQAAQRAVEYDIGDGRVIRLCSAEDLIIHKLVAGRPQDIADVEGVLLRQKGRLDLAYIRHWLSQFAEALETPDLLATFEQLRQKVAD
ncbi:MAG: hypothetical protein RRB24_03290 [Armatimonadota bacterium]|jgi:hypothetical protein|nr:hypothetical protein [Armatimonadota bacterium]MDT7971830.1 hypothetical protein [Armatimonadota bacterium]